MNARRLTLALAALGALALPSAASASSAQVIFDPGKGYAVVYDADDAEQNRVTVTQSGDTFSISDPGATILAGTGCSASGSSATCTQSGVYQVKADLLDGDDTITGNITADVRLKVYAGDGNDAMYGGPGEDNFYGGVGDDWMRGGAAADSFRGEDGRDVADFSDHAVPVTSNPGTATDDGAAGENDMTAATTEGAVGGAGNDVLVANDNGGTLAGGAGDDTLTGGLGDDLLDGGTGTDVLAGRDGGDLVRTRDGAAESPACGAGADSVEADHADAPAADCEQVSKSEPTEGEAGGEPYGPGVGGADGSQPESGTGSTGGEGGGPVGGVIVPARPMTMPAPGVALVHMQCAATAVDGCRGEVILEMTVRVPLRSRAVAARGRYVARQHRVGRRGFRANSGKSIRVRVRLNQRGHAILRSRRRARGRIRIKHRDVSGRVIGETTRQVVFTARKWGRRKVRRSAAVARRHAPPKKKLKKKRR